MRRAFAIATIAGLAVLMSAGTQASGRATKTVQVNDDFFSPPSLTIKEDKTLTFEWVGEDDHNVYKKSGPGNNFDSQTHEAPYVYTRKFKKPGKYVLGCILHEKMLMDLKVKKRRR